ncbi:ribosomal RNA small subunit methyltransferase F [Lacimicrobium alkaliphilum]|uniref:Ribosomal RNA small subunit methyltransferase F n=2 Tax=Lacimicrobium alkaliphilum TaxID=1526571 RepID=A0ABQ1QZ01_9ALTE|nr:ribosomal RNA small subunit methyltransferase F [Lacimicrobium alkaliphilum]
MSDFVETCKTPLRKSIRVNTLKISVEDFCEKMRRQQWYFTAIPWCNNGFWLQRTAEQEQSVPLGSTPEHLAGLFYIQEASSMLPPLALIGNALPETVLDMAAAPGSKTSQLSALMQNKGLLVANELAASRIKSMAAVLQRLGVTNTAISHFDGNVFGEWLPESFDAILVDAPCGGEGTIRKDPDALKNWSHESIKSISWVQKKLIDSAFKALKPGGCLVYSTCTLNHQENQAVCNHLADIYDDAVQIEPLNNLFPGADKAVTEEGYLHIWPQIFDSEGFFVARLRKSRSLGLPVPGPRKAQVPYIRVTEKQQKLINEYLFNQFGYTLPEDKSLFIKEQDFWLLPEQAAPLLSRFRFQRIGLRLATQHKSGFRLTHDAAIALGTGFTRQRLALTTAQLREYCQGRDLQVDEIPPQGEILLTWQEQPVGMAKGLGQRVKNSLPRELVRDNLPRWNGDIQGHNYLIQTM